MKARILSVVLALGLAVSASGIGAAATHGAGVRHTPATHPAAAANGTLKIEYTTDFITLDPALALDLDGWMTVWSVLFDQLYRFNRFTQFYPDVAAAMPQVTGGGTVYTIPIRHGIRFSNGREITAGDVAYSLTRTIDPKTKAFGQSFFTTIAGANDFINGKAKSVKGIQVLGRYLLRITLTHPQAVFMNDLATSSASIVPKEEVARWGKTWGRHPVGSGPYVLKQWTSGRQLVFVRNPYYHGTRPSIGTVVYEVGANPSVALLRVQKGQADIAGDGLNGNDIIALRNDATWSKNLVGEPTPWPQWLQMNTRMKPFNNKLVRQAVAMAINRLNLLKVINGQGQMMEGQLPPMIPGYDPSLKGYPYNPTRAKQLLAKAGYPHGFTTTLFYSDQPGLPSIVNQVIQQQLAQVGITVKLRDFPDPSTYLSYIAQPNHAPILTSGWWEDYPDPYDFIALQLTCAAAVPGGVNYTFYCNPKMDALVNAAEQTTDTTKRLALYKRANAIVQDDAVKIALFNWVWWDVHAPRLKGFSIDPTYSFYHFQDMSISG